MMSVFIISGDFRCESCEERINCVQYKLRCENMFFGPKVVLIVFDHLSYQQE